MRIKIVSSFYTQDKKNLFEQNTDFQNIVGFQEIMPISNLMIRSFFAEVIRVLEKTIKFFDLKTVFTNKRCKKWFDNDARPLYKKRKRKPAKVCVLSSYYQFLFYYIKTNLLLEF